MGWKETSRKGGKRGAGGQGNEAQGGNGTGSRVGGEGHRGRIPSPREQGWDVKMATLTGVAGGRGT